MTGRRRIARMERSLAKTEKMRARMRRACTASSHGGNNHSLAMICPIKKIPAIDMFLLTLLLFGLLSISPNQTVLMAPDRVASCEEVVELEPRETEP